MLIVLTSQADTASLHLVSAWAANDARLVRPEHLSRRGWVWRPDSAEASQLVADDVPVPVAAVEGVLTLLPAVTVADLAHITPEDREYVAAEMTAFLAAWLGWLVERGVPVVNRPAPGNLAGPALREEGWLLAAARAGLATRPVRPRAGAYTRASSRRGRPDPATSVGWPPSPLAGSSIAVPVVGGRCLPDASGRLPPEREQQAIARLATNTAVDLMTVGLVQAHSGWRFIGAVPMADITREDVAGAALACLVTAA